MKLLPVALCLILGTSLISTSLHAQSRTPKKSKKSSTEEETSESEKEQEATTEETKTDQAEEGKKSKRVGRFTRIARGIKQQNEVEKLDKIFKNAVESSDTDPVDLTKHLLEAVEEFSKDQKGLKEFEKRANRPGQITSADGHARILYIKFLLVKNKFKTDSDGTELNRFLLQLLGEIDAKIEEVKDLKENQATQSSEESSETEKEGSSEKGKSEVKSAEEVSLLESNPELVRELALRVFELVMIGGDKVSEEVKKSVLELKESIKDLAEEDRKEEAEEGEQKEKEVKTVDTTKEAKAEQIRKTWKEASKILNGTEIVMDETAESFTEDINSEDVKDAIKEIVEKWEPSATKTKKGFLKKLGEALNRKGITQSKVQEVAEKFELLEVIDLMAKVDALWGRTLPGGHNQMRLALIKGESLASVKAPKGMKITKGEALAVEPLELFQWLFAEALTQYEYDFRKLRPKSKTGVSILLLDAPMTVKERLSKKSEGRVRIVTLADYLLKKGKCASIQGTEAAKRIKIGKLKR